MAIWSGISKWWCQSMHDKAMWPIHGKYVCRVCRREYPIAWFQEEASMAGEHQGRIAAAKLGLERSRSRVETL